MGCLNIVLSLYQSYSLKLKLLVTILKIEIKSYVCRLDVYHLSNYYASNRYPFQFIVYGQVIIYEDGFSTNDNL